MIPLKKKGRETLPYLMIYVLNIFFLFNIVHWLFYFNLQRAKNLLYYLEK